jgi:hypothetical protein
LFLLRQVGKLAARKNGEVDSENERLVQGVPGRVEFGATAGLFIRASDSCSLESGHGTKRMEQRGDRILSRVDGGIEIAVSP